MLARKILTFQSENSNTTSGYCRFPGDSEDQQNQWLWDSAGELNTRSAQKPKADACDFSPLLPHKALHRRPVGDAHSLLTQGLSPSTCSSQTPPSLPFLVFTNILPWLMPTYFIERPLVANTCRTRKVMYPHKEHSRKGEKNANMYLKTMVSNYFLEHDLHLKVMHYTMGIFIKNGPCMHLLSPILIGHLAILRQVNTSVPRARITAKLKEHNPRQKFKWKRSYV